MTTAADYTAQAMTLINKLIAPAKLRDSNYNRTILFAECARLNLASNAVTIEEAAVRFRKAVVSIRGDPSRALNTLIWDVEPASLAKYRPEQKQENPLKIARDQQDAINKEEERKAYEKKQKTGEARAIELINSFHPVSFRGTEFAIQADTKKLLTDYVNKQKSKGADMAACADAVSAHIQKVYKEVESRGVNSQ